MADNFLTPPCLIDEEATSNAIPVEIPSSGTVDDLKISIKNGKTSDFNDFNADRLVSIPGDDDNDDDDEQPILLDKVSEEMKLTATTKLSKVVDTELPEDTIHIPVQRPPPASPTRPISVRASDIEKELVGILKTFSCRHVTHSIDPKDVETAQREKLGPFYKRTLPYHDPATNTSLVMLGLALDKKVKTGYDKTLRYIVYDDFGLRDSHSVVAMVAPPGSGKTATVVDLAAEHFVVYFACCSAGATDSPDFKDPNFVNLAKDVERIYTDRADREPTTLDELLDLDSNVKALIGERVELEILARLVFLQLLLNNNPKLEPIQYFREQTTGGASTIGELADRLREYDNNTIQAMLHEVETKVDSLLGVKGNCLVIALDEAHIAEKEILADKLVSPFAMAKSRGGLFDDNNQIRSELRRGFLTPLTAALNNIKATLVILGTKLSLQDTDHVYTDVGKKTSLINVMDFPRFDQDDVDKILSDLVDMSDCEISPAKRHKLTGRAQFSVGVIDRLVASGSIQASKQDILDNAIDDTIEYVMGVLRKGARTILESDKTGEDARLLRRMVLAYHLQDDKISFPSRHQSDYVEMGLCRLLPHHNGDIHLVMDEPMVVEAVEEELKASHRDSAFSEYLGLLYQSVNNFGVTSTSKENVLELLVRRSLQRFSGCRLVDLPFLRGVTLPTWCYTLQFQIDSINTAKEFGYTAIGIRGDLAFLTERPPNKMLIACSSACPHGSWFFSNRRYAGSLAIQLYSGRQVGRVNDSIGYSSSVRDCFSPYFGYSRSSLKGNPSLKDIRSDFEDSRIPSDLRGTLRIHVVFPDGECRMPATHTWRHPVTGIEDVMVYINLLNMDDLFFEGISEQKDDMVLLKKLIRFVCQE
ncbi:hypothetical protein EC957_000583 [Mortierella hygrophila]|uniref:Crinkler effector protein N-terminal domain-containing protein n=1 Tax=Mortierella hygrophila TaxID=979708 RepID=A0A9P6F5V1_9FUNG|nr:hypothetical protein EC957_000583 [Mortierella hygrophila]